MAKEKEKEKNGEEGGMLSHMLESRTIIISGAVDAELASKIIRQLILLDHDNPEKMITMLVNSPGGEVFSGFAIYDIIRFINSPVTTVAVGLAASMGSIIPLAADKKNRFALPNAKFLIHQPLLMGYQGRATDMEIQAKEILRDRERIIDIYAENTGRDTKVIGKDIDRDNWMNPNEALKYGLIHKVITSRSEIPS